MRTIFFIPVLLCAILINGCNKKPKPVSENDLDTSLPKGRYVVDENSDVKILDPQTGAFNKYKGKSNDPSTTGKASAYDEFKKRYKNLLVFHVADTMKLRKSYIATLILGKDQVLGDLREEAMENSTNATDSLYTDTETDFGNKMKARLIDMSGAENKGFIIELLGGEDAATQSITEKRKKAIWQWKLSPQTPGQQELRLSINIIQRNGETVSLPARNIAVIIYAENEGFGEMGKKFFEDYGKWILASILIPIFVAWFTTRMRNKGMEKQSHPKDKTTEAENKSVAVNAPQPTDTNTPSTPGA